jgi:hypothetical protein
MSTESDLPICMQDGWDPFTPGREWRARLLDAAIAAREDGDLDEADRLSAMAIED